MLLALLVREPSVPNPQQEELAVGSSEQPKPSDPQSRAFCQKLAVCVRIFKRKLHKHRFQAAAGMLWGRVCVCEHAGLLPGMQSSVSADQAVSVIPAVLPSSPVTRASDSCLPGTVMRLRGASSWCGRERTQVCRGWQDRPPLPCALVGVVTSLVNQYDLKCIRPAVLTSLQGQTGIPLPRLPGQLGFQ